MASDFALILADRSEYCEAYVSDGYGVGFDYLVL